MIETVALQKALDSGHTIFVKKEKGYFFREEIDTMKGFCLVGYLPTATGTLLFRPLYKASPKTERR